MHAVVLAAGLSRSRDPDLSSEFQDIASLQALVSQRDSQICCGGLLDPSSDTN